MKKLLAFLLAAVLILSLAACGGEQTQKTPETTAEPEITGFLVPQPMTERPNYAVSENPTTEELRETAVRAMHDMLSIQWSYDKVIDYNKTGAVSEKDYHYDPETIYCGLPYADGQTNLYVWLEYYDMRTGQMRLDGDGQWLNDNLGNTCAGSLMWAWSTVCDSLTGKFVNTSMVPKFGCIPVGTYTCSAFSYMDEYYDYGTDKICSDNGIEVMFESYAQIKKADAITSSTKEHTMMSTTDAVVVYNEDGSINGQESYIMVQDQAAGTGDKFFEHVGEDGKTYHYTGRTGPIELKCSFLWMFQAAYIPVTTAEFLGQEPYVKAEVKINKECTSLDDLCNATISSNYPMCMFKVIATDANGKQTALHTLYFDRYDVQGSADGNGFDGKARNYKLSGDKIAIVSAAEELASGTYTITAEATASTGEVFTPATFTYSK